MGEYNNSFCRICGTPYHRCNCKSEDSWRKVTDTAEHYQIFCVVRDYVNGIIDANKANKLLEKMDLSNKDTFRENVKNVLNEIAIVKKTEFAKKEVSPVKQLNTSNANIGKPNQRSNDKKTWKK